MGMRWGLLESQVQTIEVTGGPRVFQYYHPRCPSHTREPFLRWLKVRRRPLQPPGAGAMR